MINIKNFIETHGLEYDWQGHKWSRFMLWIPFHLLPDFLSETKILNHTEYCTIGNCGICEYRIVIDLTEVFEEEDIEEVFPRIMD